MIDGLKSWSNLCRTVKKKKTSLVPKLKESTSTSCLNDSTYNRENVKVEDYYRLNGKFYRRKDNSLVEDFEFTLLLTKIFNEMIDKNLSESISEVDNIIDYEA